MPSHSQSKLSTLAAVILCLNLSGCALFGWDTERGITINKKAVERTPLNLSDPAPLRPSSPRWIVITPENQAQVFKELKDKNVDQVLFGLTDDGYEELATDTAQVRNFIAQQREILKKYREYYEPKTEEKK